MRILIAQEDSNIASRINICLSAEGFGTDVITDGETALWHATEGDYAAVILDVVLSKLNGYDVCQIMRNSGIKTPVLILTHKTKIGDEIQALETGADDYLRIPFSSSVLIARIKALLRRSQNVNLLSDLCFGSLCYNQKNRKFFFNETEIKLTIRESAVLELLLQANGDVVSKQALIKQIWGIDFSGDPNIVDVYIGYVRRKLCINCNSNFIETVRGVGYRLINVENS